MSKIMGKIIEYDGNSGIVIDKNNIKHIFTKEEVYSSIKVNDLVTFESEIFSTVENKIYIARFIKLIEK